MMDEFSPPARKQPERNKALLSKPPKGMKPKLDSFWPESGLAEDRDEVSEIIPGKVFLTNYRGALLRSC